MRSLVTLPPRGAESDGRLRVVADVVDGEELWFEVDAEHRALLTDRADHVALAMLMPAMRAGRPLHVGGVMTDVLLHQMNHELQELIRCLSPAFHHVAVTTDEAAPSRKAAAGVATGLSNGVDSLSVVSDYALRGDAPESLRITHLLNNNVGSHGRDGRELWHRRAEGPRRLAAQLDLPLVLVDSNVDAHYPRIGFSYSATLRNAAVAHLLGGGVGRLLYASSNNFADVRVRAGGEISRIDTLILPLLSTSAVTLSSAGSGVTRVEKILALADRPEMRYLDVCIAEDPQGPVNCSRCTKCARTMLTLEIAGRLDEFCPEPFLLEPYLARRDDYLVDLLTVESGLAGEVIDFAAERGWRFSLRTRLRAVLRRARRAGRRRARALRNRVRPHRPS